MSQARIALVTGGTSGIGAQVGRELAKRGWRVMFVGRDRERGKAMLEQLTALASAAGGAAPHCLHADLSAPDELQRVIAEVRRAAPRLDALIHSAGALFTKRRESPQGLELTLATQYLARATLTRELEPVLQNAPDPRVVFVGAPLMKRAAINWEDPHYRRRFTLMNAMMQSQLACHLFVQEYARRNPTGVAINVANVGIVKSGLQREMTGPMALVFKLVGALSAIPAEQGAANSVALASDERLKGITGHFFSKPGDPQKHAPLQLPADWAARLWNETDKWAQPQR